MKKSNSINGLQEGILLVLRYFGIFRYPLTANEIHIFNPIKASKKEIDLLLFQLVEGGAIFKQAEFYMMGQSPEWIEARISGNERARQLLNQSEKYIRIIAACPFVRGIAISGSLSKMYASSQADIDYFIITENNRLWIARTLLHIFKKLTFITGHQHYFCMNYFVDTTSLTILHQNQYSAIETLTLLPVYNENLINELKKSNEWTKEFLPNYPSNQNSEYLIKPGHESCKMISEKLINFFFLEKLNKSLMKITDKKWRLKWEKCGYDMKEYDHAFYTNLHVSKNHPTDYEKIVLTELNNK